MKKLLLTLMVLNAGFAALAQTNKAIAATAATSPAELLQWKELSYDFGKIPQGKPVTHIFEVINTSKEIVTLDNVQASCGCTTPEWSKDPIAPGGKQKITVGYNAAAEGAFEKTITVYYGGQMKNIIIKGVVWKTPDHSAPQNSSVAILKNINQ
ncbi:MAG: DUF1573 domain-containing protein [Chitinophagaceae bacterium]|nr:DUF1573 domain-containing protein [Chitinophagaceae bacterium]